MKASPEFRTALDAAIAPYDIEENRARYRAGDFPRSERTKDLNKRYRWDLFWMASTNDNRSLSELARIEDLNDDHIDTVLKSLIASL
jgi:hypothetical protein